MNIQELVVEFLTVFAVTLITVAFVTYRIGRGEGPVDWETSFRFAAILGVVLTWVKSRETKEK